MRCGMWESMGHRAWSIRRDERDAKSGETGKDDRGQDRLIRELVKEVRGKADL